MKTNSELRALARSQLKGSWLTAVGVILIYFILFGHPIFYRELAHW